MRERIIAAPGRREDREDRDAEDLDLPPRRIAAGKATAADAREHPDLATQVRPGKLAHADADEHAMSPDQALRYADWMLSGARVHRRAELDAGGDADGGLAAAFSFLEDSRGGRSLPDALVAQLSAELGADLSRVRIHTDGRAAEAAAALHARAFTIGEDIYFAASAYDPDSEAGVRLIAHEAAHVAQTQRGTAGSSRRVSRPDDAHEREAEAFAQRFRRRAAAADPRDPATVVEQVRREGTRTGLPFLRELEEHFETSFDFVELYTGEAARVACQALSASAFAIHNIVAIADPSPRRDQLLHELTHVMQMGRRSAPRAFAPGSLGISDPHGAAETEAARGTGHRAAASPAHVHRDPAGTGSTGTGGTGTGTTGGASDTSSEAIKKRFAWFAAGKPSPARLVTYPRKDPEAAATGGTEEEVYRFATKSGTPYKSASEDTFSRENYLAAFRTGNPPADLKRADATIGPDLAAIANNAADAQSFRLSRVSPRVYVFTGDGTWEHDIKDNASAERKAATPAEQFKVYFAAYEKLKAKGRVNPFTLDQLTEKNCTYTTEQATEYRHQLTDSVAAAYVGLGDKSWDSFYEEVMQGRVFPATHNRIQGNIFEKIVHDTVGAELKGEQPIFRKKGVLTKDPRLGDDAKFVAGGAIVIDAKAVEGTVDADQAADYEKITDPKRNIRGYFKGQDAETAGKQYKAVGYAIPGGDRPADPTKPNGPTRADRVQTQLEKIFPDKNRFYVSPNPSGMRKWLLSFNPSIALQSTDQTKTSYTFTNPPSLLPGVSVKSATINVSEPGGADIQGGTVTMGIDMAGAFTADDVTKQIPPGGQVENKFGNFKSKLDKLLGPFTADAKLTDDGVQAEISLQPGAAKLPGFTVDAAKLTARLTGDAALTVDGEVGITHKSGKISGKVKVGWASGEWSFEGKATLAAGLVEGLSEVELGVKYENGETTIFCTEASYTRKLGAVTLTGTVNDLEYNIKKESFSGTANIEADLGMFGKARASGTVENNKLKNAELAVRLARAQVPGQERQADLHGHGRRHGHVPGRQALGEHPRHREPQRPGAEEARRRGRPRARGRRPRQRRRQLRRHDQDDVAAHVRQALRGPVAVVHDRRRRRGHRRLRDQDQGHQVPRERRARLPDRQGRLQGRQGRRPRRARQGRRQDVGLARRRLRGGRGAQDHRQAQRQDQGGDDRDGRADLQHREERDRRQAQRRRDQAVRLQQDAEPLQVLEADPAGLVLQHHRHLPRSRARPRLRVQHEARAQAHDHARRAVVRDLGVRQDLRRDRAARPAPRAR